MTHREENNKLINDFMERTVYRPFRTEDGTNRKIELMFRPQCNLACEYCYLHKHGDELFEGVTTTNEEMLKNVDLILDWYIENEFKTSIDLFSGELFASDFGFQVLDLIYNRFKDVDRSKSFVRAVLIPTNMTFIKDDEVARKVEQYLAKYREAGIALILSASVDGKYIEQNRPYLNGKEDRDDEYYDKLFELGRRNRIGYHPMVSAYRIENWIDNYKWFYSKINPEGTKINRTRFPMMLEVRDDNWTPEAIAAYLNFINYQIDFEYNLYKEADRLDIYLDKVFDHSKGSYENTGLYFHGGGNDSISCSIYNAFTIRVPDLSIVPCHRTSYNPFIYGKFNVEDGRIKNIEAGNPELCLTIESMQYSSMPLCSNCGIKSICMKGCLGSQFEYSKDLFTPNKTVCDLFKAKYAFLIMKYKSLGILDMFYASDKYPPVGKEMLSNIERSILKNAQ